MAETVHQLKIWPNFFAEIVSGRKKFDIRDGRDRCFQAGDVIQFREFDPKKHEFNLGAPVHMRISAVYSDLPGLQPGYVALGIIPVNGVQP